MGNWQGYLTRCLASITSQTYTNYEVVLIKHSTMPVTSNRTIESSNGEIIKLLYMDDFLAHENSLQEIANQWPFDWLVTGCNHSNDIHTSNPHLPEFSGILTGTNTIGSPSVLAFANKNPLLFDENLSWTLDTELYIRLYERYGLPKILNDINVTIGIHAGQMTNILTHEEKRNEEHYLQSKHKL